MGYPKDYHQFGLVYSLKNVVTGQVYVGQTTTSLKTRWSHHLDYFQRGGNSKLCIALAEHGRDSFCIEPLQYCENQQELDESEQRWIARLDSYEGGYNHTPNGRQGGKKGTTRSPESNLKQAEAMRGRKLTDPHKAAISNGLRGKPKSESHKQALRKPKRKPGPE